MHTRRHGWWARLRLLLVTSLVAFATLSLATPTRAAGVVGSGTPASCTWNALATAILDGPGTITFNCGSVPHTIVFQGFLEIPHNILINGGNRVTLSGAGKTFHFQVFNGRQLTLRNITLIRGRAAAAGSVENFGTLILDNAVLRNNTSTASGGAIMNYGTISLIKNSLLEGNLATASGGAIYNDGGNVTVNVGQIRNNTALQHGGGIYSSGGKVTLTQATISGNRATSALARGGGIAVFGGTLTVNSLVMRGNDATYGGAIATDESGIATVRGAELSGNTAETGGAIALKSGGPHLFRNSTLSGNHADFEGGGLWVEFGVVNGQNLTINRNSASNGGGIYSIEGTVRLKNTIVGNSVTGGECDGPTPVTSQGFNIASDATCNLTRPTDRPSVNPRLGALADNGGFSLSHMPLSNSLAIDRGDACPAPDQRGFARVFGPACDIGSIEVGSTAP